MSFGFSKPSDEEIRKFNEKKKLQEEKNNKYVYEKMKKSQRKFFVKKKNIKISTGLFNEDKLTEVIVSKPNKRIVIINILCKEFSHDEAFILNPISVVCFKDKFGDIRIRCNNELYYSYEIEYMCIPEKTKLKEINSKDKHSLSYESMTHKISKIPKRSNSSLSLKSFREFHEEANKISKSLNNISPKTRKRLDTTIS